MWLSFHIPSFPSFSCYGVLFLFRVLTALSPPKSIMPLQFLIPALLRATSAPGPAAAASSPQEHEQEREPRQVAGHPLHSLLRPILLASRAASHKYHTRIPGVISEEGEPADPEEEYVWYAYHKDKVGEDERERPAGGQDEYEAQERLKRAWLEKYERREYVSPPPPPMPCVSAARSPHARTDRDTFRAARVQIQMLLYFLLVSLPRDRAAASGEDAGTAIADSRPLPPSLSPSKSKKRKHKDRGRSRAQDPPPQPLEERLESYMDKLAMWQLMRAVDSSLGRDETPSKSAIGNGKTKAKQKDDRDWMQAFCEDMVEPLFVFDIRPRVVEAAVLTYTPALGTGSRRSFPSFVLCFARSSSPTPATPTQTRSGSRPPYHRNPPRSVSKLLRLHLRLRLPHPRGRRPRLPRRGAGTKGSRARARTRSPSRLSRRSASASGRAPSAWGLTGYASARASSLR